VEIVDDGTAAEVKEVLAGATIAGAAPLPAADVGKGVLDGHALAELGTAGRGGLAPAALQVAVW
jgi:hypothetical protein